MTQWQLMLYYVMYIMTASALFMSLHTHTLWKCSARQMTASKRQLTLFLLKEVVYEPADIPNSIKEFVNALTCWFIVNCQWYQEEHYYSEYLNIALSCEKNNSLKNCAN